jgi:hypothetical protein
MELGTALRGVKVLSDENIQRFCRAMLLEVIIGKRGAISG